MLSEPRMEWSDHRGAQRSERPVRNASARASVTTMESGRKPGSSARVGRGRGRQTCRPLLYASGVHRSPGSVHRGILTGFLPPSFLEVPRDPQPSEGTLKPEESFRSHTASIFR